MVAPAPTTYPDYPVLLVDDDTISLTILEHLLKQAGVNHLLICQDSRRVCEILARQPVTLILLDLEMPHVGGEQLLQTIIQDYPETAVAIITGSDDVNTAVRCIKRGAFDYIVKPVTPSRLATVLNQVLAFQELRQENLALKRGILSPTLDHPEAFAEIVTGSRQMASLFHYAESIATTKEPVLITGETGVGKELVARAIHRLSARTGRFVAVNMAGLDDTVFSDTLFGHTRGAFTGADRVREGLIEQAGGGTLFLDEIGDLTLSSQAKLLRLLQNGDYLPLGRDTPRHSDARVLSATNRDLWMLAREDKFRRDLNYRLRTHHIHIPPLRERKEDLPLLIDHFLTEFARELDRPKPALTRNLINLLNSYGFPGNVRELRSMIFNAMSLNNSKTLSLQPFESHIRQSREAEGFQPGAMTDSTYPLGFAGELPTLREATDWLIEEALRRAEGNQSLAGRLLGVSQQAISKRLKKQRG